MLIKVDVEGAEMSVLRGAGETLAASPAPTWLVEINLDEHHPAGQNPDFQEAFEVFWSHGYIATSVDTKRLVNATEATEWVRAGKRSFGGSQLRLPEIGLGSGSITHLCACVMSYCLSAAEPVAIVPVQWRRPRLERGHLRHQGG